MTTKTYRIVDDNNKVIDELTGLSEFKAEQALTRCLNHDEDAYLQDEDQAKESIIMTTKALPKEFKFKADDKPKHTVKFILFLLSQGFETVCNKEEFITSYVLSNQFDAYAVENNKIVLHGSSTDFENDPQPEVYISDFNLDKEISTSVSNAIDNKDLIDRTIKSLSQISPSKLSLNEVNDIECFRLQLKSMKV